MRKNTLLKKMLKKLSLFYHFLFVFLGAVIYRFPSKKINVVAVTGTKGKSTVTELINSILEEAGYKTALSNTIRFKIGNDSRRNLLKMTMPGRFFLQKLLRQAVNFGCHYAVIEMTSEGARQFRNKFINLNALIMTNISPEHIESHGSYEKYLNAKLSIAKSLSKSKKLEKVLVVNTDDKEAKRFLEYPVEIKKTYSLKEVEKYNLGAQKTEFVYKNVNFETKLLGIFNIYNCLASIKYAESQGISPEMMRSAVNKLKMVPGRVEFIEYGQNFDVVVDYAHTIDSLEKFYNVFSDKRKICVLGNTGGGRDRWKRPEMGRIANRYCEKVILTNEDPYDENPEQIINDMAVGVAQNKLKIIPDRKEAIKEALNLAHSFSKNESANNVRTAVLITGKGTDPFIMGPNGTKIPWDDAQVVKEELSNLGFR